MPDVTLAIINPVLVGLVRNSIISPAGQI